MTTLTKQRGILITALCVAGAVAIVAPWYFSQAAGRSQKSFSTPKAAAKALLEAAAEDDTKTLLLLFGRNGKEIVTSGDPIRDKNNRAQFVERASQSMTLQRVSSDRRRAFVLIGEDQFPFPVPIVKTGDEWRFDSGEGKQELLARRIGSNELDTIELCHKFVDAEYQFAAEDQDGSGVSQYAQRFISSPGNHDGLYGPVPSGGLVSPIENLVTEAAAEGYDTGGVKPVPYHGYRFQFLAAQGPNAQGGAREYMVHDLVIGGFGLIAWPVEYGVSGMKTFQVNQTGLIFEKDLGTDTAAKASAMKRFDPDSSWRVVQ